MAILDLFRSRGESPVARRRRRKTDGGSPIFRFFEHNRLVTLAIFLLTVAAIFIISFVGVSPTAFRILEGQTASIRIVADADFSYTSAILTRRARERIASEIPPVFKVDLTEANQHEEQVRKLLAELNKLEPTWATLSEPERARALEPIVLAARAEGTLQPTVRDLTLIMNYGDAAARENLINTGLFVLREIQRSGVFDSKNDFGVQDDASILVYRLRRESGDIGQARVVSLEDAMTYLRANLNAENIPDLVREAVYRLLRGGLHANLKLDTDAQAELRAQAMRNLKEVVQHVQQGQVIIEPNIPVSPEQFEMLQEYQKFLRSRDQLPSGMDRQTVGRILLVLGVIVVAGFYIRLEDPMTLQSNARLALLALVLVFSLTLVRLTVEGGNTALVEKHPDLGGVLPYLAPMAFAPMVIAVLVGAGPALFSGLLISVFTAIIFGNRLEVLVLSLVAATVAAYDCRAVRRRSRIVRAGFMSGVVLALFAALLGTAEGQPWDVILKAAVGALVIGILTGIIVVGLLPVLEALFKRTTDITLLELTDFNHPLLRRMQMEAPGTYHHSLMVANLSENAANAIGANALLCRVCCMFHDIGKLVKPDYFMENQREGVNPHSEHTPSFSALIIKSHVKEGLDLAIKHNLPRPVVDVIRQHHGTTLIRYFFAQAQEKSRVAGGAGPGTRHDPNAVAESTYRYDGPKPKFKESAIILFADSVEAASRSLQKVTPQAIEDLIDAIIREKVEDGQVDDAPLTVQEIALIKRSFTFTLLNSLHSRVVYPKHERGGTASLPARSTPATLPAAKGARAQPVPRSAV